MRAVTTAALAALTLAASISMGYAQTNLQSAKPTGYSQGPATSSAAADERLAAADHDNFWPNPKQEAALPYRPCSADVELLDGHHSCLDDY